MYAIIDFKGKQFSAEKDKKIKVPYLADKEAGNEVIIEDVLLLNTGDDIVVGAPKVSNAKVIAEVVNHVRDPKVIVFKKKRRKGYVNKNGHRQSYTNIIVKDIQV